MELKKQSEYGKLSDLTFLELFKRCSSGDTNNTEADLKLFCYLVSKMQTKLRLMNNAKNDEVYLDDYGYLVDDEESRYLLYIKINKLIKNSTKSKLTPEELQSLLYRLLSVGVIVDNGNNRATILPAFIKFEISLAEEDKDVAILFNGPAIEMLIELKESWIYVYSQELKELTGKFMIGLYYQYRKFRRTGVIKMSIDEAKLFFMCSTYSNIEFNRRLKGYIEKFNSKLGTDLKLETLKKEGRTSGIKITFTPEKANKK